MELTGFINHVPQNQSGWEDNEPIGRELERVVSAHGLTLEAHFLAVQRDLELHIRHGVVAEIRHP